MKKRKIPVGGFVKVLWIAGLPEEVRMAHPITDVRSAAWSWVMGSLPPPEDVELHVVCPVFGMRERETHFDYAGAHWHCFRLKRFEPLFLRRRFTRQIRPFVRELKPDVIHGWGGESGCGLVATYLSKRAVVSVQGLLRMLKIGLRTWRVESSPDERGAGYWLRCRMEAMTYRRACRLICESETAQSWLAACYGREANVAAYPLRKEFVEIGLGRRSRSTEEREGLGRRVLFVGQDVPRKGGGDAERACEGIAALMKAEGKTAAELVELMGSVDAMIVPSYGDTGPTALKEALSQGVYPIVYDNTGAAELVRKYGFGTLVPTGDVEALRKAVEALGEQDREFCREQGREVAERVREGLSRERAWEDYLDAYARVGFALPPTDQLQGAVGQRVRHFAKMLARNPFSEQVVISFHTGLRPNLVAAVKAKLRGRKVIREINEWPLSVIWGESKLKQWIEIHVLPKLFDGFICISDVLVDFCREHGRTGVPVLKVPMTVDVEEVEKVSGRRFQVPGFRFQVPGFRFQVSGFRFQGEGERQYVCYAGSMTEEKDGVETLKQAFEVVCSRFQDPGFKSQVPGFKSQVSGSGFQGGDLELRMICGKSHEEAIRIMKGAVCLVLARPDSLQARAGFPTKLGEYLATGVPVVVTKTGEIPRYLENGKSAYLVEPGDVAGIADAIRFVLEHPEEAARVGAAGREVARTCFDWRNHKETLNAWLKQFI